MFNLFNCQLLYIKSDLQIKMPRIKKIRGILYFFWFTMVYLIMIIFRT